MSTAGMRNVDGELLLAAAIVHECGHARCVDIGPIRYLETYRKDLVGNTEPCERCPGWTPRLPDGLPYPYRVAKRYPHRKVTAVELWDHLKHS